MAKHVVLLLCLLLFSSVDHANERVRLFYPKVTLKKDALGLSHLFEDRNFYAFDGMYPDEWPSELRIPASSYIGELENTHKGSLPSTMQITDLIVQRSHDELITFFLLLLDSTHNSVSIFEFSENNVALRSADPRQDISSISRVWAARLTVPSQGREYDIWIHSEVDGWTYCMFTPSCH